MSKILSFNQYLLENESTSAIDSFYSAIKSVQAEESPRGSNKGPEVRPLQLSVNAGPGDPWCAGYIHNVLTKTGFTDSIKKQIPDDAAVRYHWANSGGKKIEYKPSMDINSILPGMVFFYLSRDKKTGEYPGNGHTGIILSVDKANKTWTAVEGNANPLDGSREGYGTFIVTRKLSDPSISKDPKDHPAKLLGFIDYFSPYRETADFTENLSNKMKTLISELLPKTNKEISYLEANPKVLYDYERNYKNRHKKPIGGSINR